EALHHQLDGAPLALDLAGEHQVQAWVHLLLEPRLVEPHGRDALAARAPQARAHDVHAAAAAVAHAAHHLPRDGGGLAVDERAVARQRAAVLVAPREVAQQLPVGADADL